MWTVEVTINREVSTDDCADLVSQVGGALMVTGGESHPQTKLTLTTSQDPDEAQRALCRMLKVTSDELAQVSWSPAR